MNALFSFVKKSSLILFRCKLLFPILLSISFLVFASSVYAESAENEGNDNSQTANLVPGGPWPQNPILDPNKSSFLHSNAEMTDALQQVAHSSQGMIKIIQIGTSNLGNPIRAALVGFDGSCPTLTQDCTVSPDKQKIMFITQQHGNELLSSEAALQYLQTIRANDPVWNKVAVLFVVRANPDGAEPPQWVIDAAGGVPQIRFNVDALAGLHPGEPIPGETFRGALGVGYDLNRYHILFGPLPQRAPETAALVATWKIYKPQFVVDLHHNGTQVICKLANPDVNPTTCIDKGEIAPVQLLFPTDPRVASSVVQLSKQLVIHTYDALNKQGYSRPVTLYQTFTPGGIARNNYAIGVPNAIPGSASMLVEVRGLTVGTISTFTSTFGPLSNGAYTKIHIDAINSVIDGVANNELVSIDPARISEIPCPSGQMSSNDGLVTPVKFIVPGCVPQH
jgi:hypothetical protein